MSRPPRISKHAYVVFSTINLRVHALCDDFYTALKIKDADEAWAAHHDRSRTITIGEVTRTEAARIRVGSRFHGASIYEEVSPSEREALEALRALIRRAEAS